MAKYKFIDLFSGAGFDGFADGDKHFFVFAIAVMEFLHE